jgi:dihydrofolate synthase / folylpolyglutamate synthase
VSARAERDEFGTPVDAIVARLLSLHPKRIDLSLDRVLRLLERLGHPQRRLPPVIHVGGTNGKGSTIAFLRAMLEAAGRTVHVYTSPNLVRVNERFRLGRPGGGVLVSDAALADALGECERANAGSPITVFEITTAAGLLLFSRQPADMLLLEVGLGGRLDATNVVERPAATVITSVSLDHVEYLGDSVVKIAAEKAGILKPGVPAVIAPQVDEARGVIERQAARLGAPLAIAGEHWLVSQEHGRLVYQDEHGLLDLPRPRLFGRHQLDNAGSAIATLRGLGDAGIGAAAFETGLLKVDWPARLQRLTGGRLSALVPQGGELWLDGAHNPEGGRVLAAAIADMEERVPRPLVLIVGMLAAKDLEGFLRNFAGLTRRLIAVPIHQENTLPPDAIAAAARRIGIPADVSDGIEPALAGVARLDVETSPRILITGSLYLAGEVLAQNGTLPS